MTHDADEFLSLVDLETDMVLYISYHPFVKDLDGPELHKALRIQRLHKSQLPSTAIYLRTRPEGEPCDYIPDIDYYTRAGDVIYQSPEVRRDFYTPLLFDFFMPRLVDADHHACHEECIGKLECVHNE
jgi:hypothetical protein